MMWEIDLIEAESMIHSSGILDGQAYIWPDANLSAAGRSMLRVQKLREAFRNGTWKPTIDL